jgi:hypothetical protein
MRDLMLPARFFTSDFWFLPHDALRVFLFLLANLERGDKVRIPPASLAHFCLIDMKRLQEILELLQSENVTAAGPAIAIESDVGGNYIKLKALNQLFGPKNTQYWYYHMAQYGKTIRAKLPVHDDESGDSSEEDMFQPDNEELVLTPPEPKAAPKQEHVPYQDIVGLYNATVGDLLPRVKGLHDRRKARIRRLWKEHFPTLEAWKFLFETVRESPYLLGENRNGWRAGFDWILAKAVEIAEGTYKKPAKPGKGNTCGHCRKPIPEGKVLCETCKKELFPDT